MKKILIADDDEDVRNILNLYLSNNDFEVVEAQNGIEALDIIDKSFSLVIVDFVMPKINGRTVISKIKKNYNIPIILISGVSHLNLMKSSILKEIDEHITKPFSPLDVISKVKKLLS